MFEYESDWSRFTFPKPEARFTSLGEITRVFPSIDLSGTAFDRAGPPLAVSSDHAVVNDETEHWFVIGETGSKKTRCFVRPLIPILAGAGESMFVVDVKGELSTDPKIRNYLAEHNVKQVFLDFRTFQSDGYNVLEHAVELYCKRKKDKAMANVTSIVSVLSSKYHNIKSDPFWECMSEQHLIPIIQMLLEICRERPDFKEYVNMLSISTFADERGTSQLEVLIKACYQDMTNNSIQMLKNVLAAPEKTKASIVATTASLLRDFLIQEDLLKMLSQSTFNVYDIYEQPTCVFLIIPDETSAYNNITGLLMDIFYRQLIEVYADKYQNRKQPPCRINWVCDEFCNVSINDMRAKISASRGRNMRWFLICQSLKQLEAAYEDSWSTIVGNCKNILFLQSADPNMLRYISELCGKTTISESGGTEPLLPVEKLKKLEKTYAFKEAIYIRDDLFFKAILPDIDRYAYLEPYAAQGPCQLPKIERKEVKAYSPGKLIDDINNDRISPPFTYREDIAELDAAFDRIFGAPNKTNRRAKK